MEKIKECITCGKEKPLSEFRNQKRNKDGKTPRCKECLREYDRQWYKKKPKSSSYKKRKRKNAKSLRIRNRQYIFNYLEKSKGCAFCGEKNPVVLEFHHLRDKEGLLSRDSDSWSLEKIDNEIEKCQVLCSNCHKLETARLENFYIWLEKEKRNKYLGLS